MRTNKMCGIVQYSAQNTKKNQNMPLVPYSEVELNKYYSETKDKYVKDSNMDVGTDPKTNYSLIPDLAALKIQLQDILSRHGINFESFDYSKDIPTVAKSDADPNDKHHLWLTRLQICIRILLDTFEYASTVTESNAANANPAVVAQSVEQTPEQQHATPEQQPSTGSNISVFVATNSSTLLSFFTKTEEERKTVLEKIRLGIWGSTTYASDIDIGIQDIENVEGNRVVGLLAFLVSVIENMYLVTFGTKSLQLDIEHYCDLMFLDHDDVGGKKQAPVYFLSSVDFEIGDFFESRSGSGSGNNNYSLAEILTASVYRNKYQSDSDKHKKETDNKTRRGLQGSGNTITVGSDSSTSAAAAAAAEATTLEVDSVVDKFSASDLLATIALPDDMKSSFNQKKGEEEEDWDKKAKTLAKSFLKMTYDDMRTTYYQKIYDAEAFFHANMAAFLSSQAAAAGADRALRLDLIAMIAMALLHRAESYVSACTVMHIVRSLQDTDPITSAKPHIGKIGYLMSLIENYGYFNRFQSMYCCNNESSALCIKKAHKKYLVRFQDALIEFTKIIDKDKVPASPAAAATAPAATAPAATAPAAPTIFQRFFKGRGAAVGGGSRSGEPQHVTGGGVRLCAPPLTTTARKRKCRARRCYRCTQQQQRRRIARTRRGRTGSSSSSKRRTIRRRTALFVR